jgi:AGCS family alanine or glycine:cation symporter
MIGTVVSLDLVWAVSDVVNGLMAFPNLVGLLLLSGVVVKETRAFLMTLKDEREKK